MKCRVCRCTEARPCNPPCAWVEPGNDLCTSCADAAAELAGWLDDAHRPSFAALRREAEKVREVWAEHGR